MIFFSCSKKNEDINYIDVYFLPPDTTFPNGLDCDMLYQGFVGEILLHKRIDEKSKTSKFKQLYDQLIKENTESSQDVRIRCMIHFSNGKVDTLCLGEYFDTFINKEKVKDSSDLLHFLKGEIDYENSIKQLDLNQ